MTENVQCPVCTLFLHAGMNLSDHLETHPKEQVIRALVQMTISGGPGGGQSNAALASILSGESSSTVNETKKSNGDREEKPSPPGLKDKELNTESGSSSSAKLSCSQNTSNILNYSTTNNDGHNEIEHHRKDQSQSRVLAKAPVKAEINSIVKDHNAGNNENAIECFTKHSFITSNTSSNSTTITSHLYHQTPMELTNSSNIHNSFAMFSGNQRYDQQQRNSTNNQNQLHTTPRMPPPPPPPTTQNQLQDINRGILSSGPSGTFHSIQTQQLPHPPLPPHHLNNASSSSNRQQQMFVGQHQTSSNSQHQQNLKVIYTPTLPPPPPLQV